MTHSDERSDEEPAISPPPGERHREGIFATQLTETETAPPNPNLTNKNICTTLPRGDAYPDEATIPNVTKCCRMLQKVGESSDGQPPVASSLDRRSSADNFTITNKMSQNVPKCHTFWQNPPVDGCVNPHISSSLVVGADPCGCTPSAKNPHTPLQRIRTAEEHFVFNLPFSKATPDIQ